MTIKILIKKLRVEGREVVTDSLLRNYCTKLKLEYNSTVNYLIRAKYIIRIFRGIFYVKTANEYVLGKTKYNHLQLVAKGLKTKGVKNWYFGMHTALKLNAQTHEIFSIDEVISDTIFRNVSFLIAGHKFKFTKISPGLTKFGVIERHGIRYSDPEKTILDFIYLWRYRGIADRRILSGVLEWSQNSNVRKLKAYSKFYPGTVRNIVEELILAKQRFD